MISSSHQSLIAEFNNDTDTSQSPLLNLANSIVGKRSVQMLDITQRLLSNL